MSRRLLALNVLLAATAVVFSFQLVHIRSTKRPFPPPFVPPAVQAPVSPKDEPVPSRPSLATYGVVATRNLFNPNRSEVVTSAASAAPALKPFLHGVVIDGSTRFAYIEDPATKRVFGYKIGDAVAGGQLEQIEADRVVIKRSDGPLEVKLRDPSKPKPVVRAPTPPPRVVVPPGRPPPPSITPPGVPFPVPPGGPRPGLLPRPQGAAGVRGAPAPSR